jgi:hypothetical protein
LSSQGLNKRAAADDLDDPWEAGARGMETERRTCIHIDVEVALEGHGKSSATRGHRGDCPHSG